MPSPAVVHRGMTARAGSALHGRSPRWAPPALLAVLLLAACEGKEADQELHLNVPDNDKGYGIRLNEQQAPQMIDPGSRHVLVRVSGGRVDTIKVTIYEGGQRICEV